MGVQVMRPRALALLMVLTTAGVLFYAKIRLASATVLIVAPMEINVIMIARMMDLAVCARHEISLPALGKKNAIVEVASAGNWTIVMREHAHLYVILVLWALLVMHVKHIIFTFLASGPAMVQPQIDTAIMERVINHAPTLFVVRSVIAMQRLILRARVVLDYATALASNNEDLALAFVLV